MDLLLDVLDSCNENNCGQSTIRTKAKKDIITHIQKITIFLMTTFLVKSNCYILVDTIQFIVFDILKNR